MPRLPEVRREDADPFVIRLYDTLFEGGDPIKNPGTATGTPGNWWTVFANSPDTFKHAVAGFQYYRAPARRIDPQLRELGQMRVGWAGGSKFVFSQHCKAARSVGLSEIKIEAVAHWQVSDAFTPLERAVLAYADAIATAKGRVADGVFAALKAELDARGGIFTPQDTSLLKPMPSNQLVKLRGVLASTNTSNSGKSIYLNFSEPPDKSLVRGVLHKRDFKGNFSMEEFKKHLGKTIVLNGKPFREFSSAVLVKITSEDQISVEK